MNKYYKYQNTIKTDKSENIADLLNHYWKTISFGVIFLGYATFSIYMNINSFSYVNPDIKHIVGIGLLLLFPIATIIFISKKQINITLFETLIVASLIVFIFNMPNVLGDPLLALLLFMTLGTTVANGFIDNSNNRISENIFFDYLKTLFLLLLILYFGDKTTFYLLGFIFIAISFVTNFLYNHPDKKIFNRVASILFIFFSPLFVAHFINNHGFKMISFVKKDISIKIDNREINSTLIYQTDSELYLHDINKSFVIKKGDINGYIIFKEYKYQSKPLLDINETKSFIKNIF